MSGVAAMKMEEKAQIMLRYFAENDWYSTLARQAFGEQISPNIENLLNELTK